MDSFPVDYRVTLTGTHNENIQVVLTAFAPENVLIFTEQRNSRILGHIWYWDITALTHRAPNIINWSRHLVMSSASRRDIQYIVHYAKTEHGETYRRLR
jgi:hypothetical protein